ncbi:hypothetical protein AUJ68_01165 [Candidatus Woesearchaeota archaeon CG1_02_57_44]|nr:MAG: hypothetical protein AUJ68_01165 [Candidatus Woesearchaeota archaeon CG1_02_57_44]
MTNFRRQDSHKKKRLARSGWRSSRGVHSKVRHDMKGRVPKVKVGYRNAALGRGGDVVLVRSLEECLALTAGTRIRIARTLGTRKKLAIAEEAVKRKLISVNINPEVLKQRHEQRASEKKAAREQKKEGLEEKAKKSKSAKQDKGAKASDAPATDAGKGDKAVKDGKAGVADKASESAEPKDRTEQIREAEKLLIKKGQA